MTAPAIKDVLAEVNRLRAERGMEPLSEMPKGTPCDAEDCPLAISLRSAVLPPYWFDEEDMPIHLPAALTAFAKAFDDGAYSDLVWEAA